MTIKELFLSKAVSKPTVSTAPERVTDDLVARPEDPGEEEIMLVSPTVETTSLSTLQDGPTHRGPSTFAVNLSVVSSTSLQRNPRSTFPFLIENRYPHHHKFRFSNQRLKKPPKPFRLPRLMFCMIRAVVSLFHPGLSSERVHPRLQLAALARTPSCSTQLP
jgi:hypothetical protein